MTAWHAFFLGLGTGVVLFWILLGIIEHYVCKTLHGGMW